MVTRVQLLDGVGLLLSEQDTAIRGPDQPVGRHEIGPHQFPRSTRRDDAGNVRDGRGSLAR